MTSKKSPVESYPSRTYIGTYRIRKIGKSEQGIHMPNDVTGDYKIEVSEDGVFVLSPVGEKR
jgi:hypothetical protein